MKQRIYIAYGSNMSEVQMARRCPDAVLSGTGRIRGYELLFKGSLTGCYATIERKAGAFVPVVFWRISPADDPVAAEIAEEFDLRRAVIYSEILKPRFEE